MYTNLATSYTDIGMETGVAAADPHKLILMLFEGALLAISKARHHTLTREIPQKGQAISHAISIIENGLKTGLDMSAGGEIAKNLASLYDYMTVRLLHANLKNDVDALDEVSRLLKDIKGAWEGITPAPAAIEQVAPQRVNSYGKV